MKAGFYEADITPSIGMERPADYKKHFIDSIRDNLKVRAAVISDGKEKAAFVGVDSGELKESPIIAGARARIAQLTDIKPEAVMIGASHTHSGGPAFGFVLEDFEDAPEIVKTLVSDYSTYPDMRYCMHIADQVVTAVCEANRKMSEATLSCGAGFQEGIAFNRRCKMKNGRVYTHPGKGNPDIVGYAGPVDPEVGVLSAWNKSGKFLGCVVNYACHATTLWEGASADWIYYMEKTIRGVMGQDSVTVFFNGASGDITQVDNLSSTEREKGEKYSNIVGTSVGAEALKVMAMAEKGDFSPVAYRQKKLLIKRRRPSEKRVRESLQIVKRGLETKSVDDASWLFAKEILIADYLAEKNPEVKVELQGIQVGGALFVSNPAELFCRLGLDIKKSSPFPFTFVVELANGSVGYCPDEQAFASDGGGYETVLTSLSNLHITAGRQIADGSIALAKSFIPGKIPERPRIEAPFKPWDYGMLGPELE